MIQNDYPSHEDETDLAKLILQFLENKELIWRRFGARLGPRISLEIPSKCRRLLHCSCDITGTEALTLRIYLNGKDGSLNGGQQGYVRHACGQIVIPEINISPFSPVVRKTKNWQGGFDAFG